MNKNRRRRHQFYCGCLKLELAFRRKAKAPPINIEMLTKGKLNARTHNTTENAD